MKKIFILAAGCLGLLGLPSLVQGSDLGDGFEASGHVLVGAGWQRYRTENNTTIPIDVRGTIPGVMGVYADSNNTSARVNREDDFHFLLDEAELDIAKTFGEGIRLRADLDFGATSLNSGARFANAGSNTDEAGVLVEQVYATANVGLGNGLEVLLGRFNAPIGFEANDVVDNDTIGRSTIYRALRPISFTGVKFYYPLNDAFGFHLFGANNGLTHDDGDIVDVNTDIPSAGGRLDFNWGEEGKQSHLGGAGAFGQDHGNFKNGFTHLVDVDWQWWVTEQLAVGGEGFYRRINTRTAGNPNGQYYAGLLNLHYVFNDAWNATLKYAYAHDVDGTNEVASLLGTGNQSLTGIDQQIHEVIFSGGHAITENALFKLEAGWTELDVTGRNNRQVFSAMGGFAYLW